ncbi:AraC family transcriptional regulator [Arthrobacter sp. 260]|uniref:helix-turn-helix domain-containing protein n=1 Tax=Arthrobacter sp. 260 TaxID=2735314 RepID=UPI001491319F|nr:AraC family transcriptional regulator [Arthrobacter sp. 260]
MTDVGAQRAPFESHYRPPAGELGRFVETFWAAHGQLKATRELIAPTGSTVAAIILGPPIIQGHPGGQPSPMRRGFLIGPHEGPIINQPTGQTFAVGFVTTPVGCEALLGVRPAAVRARAVELDAVWPPASALRKVLVQAVAAGAPLSELVDVVEAALAKNVQCSIPGFERCEAAIRLLQEDPMIPVPVVASRLGLAHGSLDREFARIVGLSPRSMARIIRLRRLLADIDVHQRVRWAEVATGLGWFDQAHLIRDFSRHTGVTPGEYLAAQRAGYPPDQAAPGFVPSG